MKATLLCVLLCLLWSLVEVQSQTEYPYIFFRGTILSNNSYVNLSPVGENRTKSTLQCHTDLSTCCRRQPNGIPGRGDWFAPGSDTRLPFGSEHKPNGIYEDRQSQVVHLRRRLYLIVNDTTGIFRCVIPTIAVHDDSDPSVGDTVYVGLYIGEGGSGGPATTVTWTRDSFTITEGNKTVLDNHVTSQYTHTLTVTGRQGGLYTCIVANNRPCADSALLTVQ